MFTTEKNVQIVLVLLKQHGIKHIVISPGGTNIPIARGVQNDPFFTCYSIIDERSAMYFAIGLALELGEPVATSCTSAQATRNYIPGLTEAFYKHVPILAITMSKHPRYTYQEYMQAPDQTSLPSDAVKKTFALPIVDSQDDELQCVRMVNEAMLELTHRTPGPIQLNIPSNDRHDYSVLELPSIRTIRRYMSWEDKWDAPLKGKKIMIVIGESRPFTNQQTASIESFAASHNALVYVNHLSNYHGKYAVRANLALYGMNYSIFRDTYKPDILITIGGFTGDYPLLGKLATGSQEEFEHWRVSEDGNIVDTYTKLTKVFECPFEIFFNRLSNKNPQIEHSYFELWKNLEKKQTIPDNLSFSNMYAAQQLHDELPEKSNLHLAILHSLRCWSFLPLKPSITCYSNVGAFGIDGCMSAFLGQSVASDELSFLIIGDLSFFYDMNSIGIRHLKNNVRILLINNYGGIEFKLSRSPGSKFGSETDLYTSAGGHNGTGAKNWAESNNFKYIKAGTKDEFLQHKDTFVNKSNKPILFEVFTTQEEENEALEQIAIANKTQNGPIEKKEGKSLIGKIKQALPSETKEKIKKFLQ